MRMSDTDKLAVKNSVNQCTVSRSERHKMLATPRHQNTEKTADDVTVRRRRLL